MAIEIKAPTFPESVADGTVATWHKQPGDAVKRDELIVEIETDKVVMEVLAETDGVLVQIAKNEGDTVLSAEVLGTIEAGAVAAAPVAAPAAVEAASAAAAAPATSEAILSPAARKIADENNLDRNAIPGTGKGGRVTKEDAVAAADAKKAAPAAPAAAALPALAGDRIEKRVPMTRLRAKIAQRLVEAQSSMAMLTTYNEVNMKPIMDLRNKYKDLFEKKHNGVRLGFMSFFVKAATEALKRFPAVNASIDGNDIVYHGYCDVGVAVSS
ncbi:MAG: 2-oxo acid dehydrogenase subunit E2, partial [Pseudomonas sp.]